MLHMQLTETHLCPASGGAFYTPETIDTARLHYRGSWAPVLHAVALWLNSTGFGAAEETGELPSVTQTASLSTKSCEESVEDRMHLMLGKEPVARYALAVRRNKCRKGRISNPPPV